LVRESWRGRWPRNIQLASGDPDIVSTPAGFNADIDANYPALGQPSKNAIGVVPLQDTQATKPRNSGPAQAPAALTSVFTVAEGKNRF